MLVKSYLTSALPTIAKGLIGIIFLRQFVVYFGKDGLGQLAQMQAMVALAFAVINGTFFNYIVISKWEENKRHVSASVNFNDILSLTILASALLGLVIYFCRALIGINLVGNKDLTFEVSLLALMMPIMGFHTALSSRLCSKGFITEFNVLNTMGFISSGVLILALIHYFDLNGAFIGISIFYLIPTVFTYIGFKTYVGEKIIINLNKLSKLSYGSLAAFSFIGVYMVIISIGLRILIRENISRTMGWVEVGNWEALNKISEAYLLFATAPLATYLMPSLSSEHFRRSKYQLIKKMIVIGILIIGVASISTYLLWDSIVIKIIGEQFIDLKKYLVIEQIGDLFKITSWTFCVIALTEGKLKLIIFSEILWGTLYYCLTILLSPIYGLEGVIYAYLISYIVLASILMVGFLKNSKYIIK